MHGALAINAVPVWADDGLVTWRIFVADHTSPTITAIDLNAPDQYWTLNVAGPAKLYPSADKALVVAAQSHNEQVEFLSGGLSPDNHGDHAGIEVTEPTHIGTIQWPRPFHIVNHSGAVAITLNKGQPRIHHR
ncbi:hypothetical protein LZG00_17640 [Rhodobacteraceae bacterium LMO-12]|nr:hypothetical protein [Rhodobacteraceae bacterium LMO-JJ12]